jgi:hypothetical protein
MGSSVDVSAHMAADQQGVEVVADLFPTKTRLALLRGVGRGEVTGYPHYEGSEVDYYWDGPIDGLKVTSRVVEVLRAGWVEKGRRFGNERQYAYSMRLTDACLKVLDEGSAR